MHTGDYAASILRAASIFMSLMIMWLSGAQVRKLWSSWRSFGEWKNGSGMRAFISVISLVLFVDGAGDIGLVLERYLLHESVRWYGAPLNIALNSVVIFAYLKLAGVARADLKLTLRDEGGLHIEATAEPADLLPPIGVAVIAEPPVVIKKVELTPPLVITMVTTINKG